MPDWVNPVLIGVAFGLVLGIFVARKSNAEKPVKGGVLAQAAHYLGASLFVSAAPTVLIGAIVYRLPFVNNIVVALGILAMAGISLIIYAAVELSAEKQTA
jgi:hypothetical protein